MYRIVSLSVLLTLIVTLGLTFFRVLAPFLLPLFLAGVTAIMAQPVFNYFKRRTGGRIPWAAGLTTVTVMGLILIPIVVGMLVLTLQLYTYAATLSDNAEWADFFHTVREDAEAKAVSVFDWGVKTLNQFLPEERQHDPRLVEKQFRQQLANSLSGLGDKSLGIAGTTLNILTGTLLSLLSALISLAIFCIALYFFLADGAMLLASTEKMIPVRIDYQRQLMSQFSKVVRSVVMGTFVAALAQGVAVTAALAFFGFEHYFMLFVLCTAAALIPMVGTWPIWFPCAVSLYLHGNWIQAILLVLWGLLVVGTIDNIIRTWILNTETKLHPLLGFLSVIGGLKMLGIWGIIIGPVVASCLHGLVTIFNHELAELSRQRFGALMHARDEGKEVKSGSATAGIDASTQGTIEEHQEPNPPNPAAQSKSTQSPPTPHPQTKSNRRSRNRRK